MIWRILVYEIVDNIHEVLERGRFGLGSNQRHQLSSFLKRFLNDVIIQSLHILNRLIQLFVNLFHLVLRVFMSNKLIEVMA